MPEEQLTFDLGLGEELREMGKETARLNRAELLDLARRLAVEIALSQSDRLATADDIQFALAYRGHYPEDLGNAAGSLFRGQEWETVGWIQSARASNHARAIRIWRYRGKERTGQ